MTWIREGECNRCGECCVGDPMEDMPRPGPVSGYCPLYRIAADGRGWCSDRQHPYYLGGCIAWPDDPRQIADKPSCSYTFHWVD